MVDRNRILDVVTYLVLIAGVAVVIVLTFLQFRYVEKKVQY